MIQSLILTTAVTMTEKTNDRWEMYLDYIRKNAESNINDIKDAMAYSSEFDLYAIFYKLKIPERYHYPMMRLNGYRSPCEYDGIVNKIMLYDPGVLENVYLSYIVEK